MNCPISVIGEFSHLGCARGELGRGNSVVGCGDNLRSGVTTTSRTAGVVAVSSVICTGLSNGRDVNGVGRASQCSGLDSRRTTENRYKVRFGTWNVGTLTGRSRELAEVLRRRDVNVCCVQETKWKGEKSREIGEGYKVIYSGKTSTRNGVGVILDKDMKENVVEVVRKSDRVIVVKAIIEDKVLNIVSAYGPQVGCEESLKEEFWREMDDVIQRIPGTEDIVIGGDMNGHVGSDRTGFERLHGGYGFGVRNEAGEKILDFASAYDLAIVNTYFKKREEHYITYKSGANKSQIDYFLCRRSSVKRCKDCKVIPGESVIAQHRLMVMELWYSKMRANKKRNLNKEKRIRWQKLCGENEKLFVNKLNDIGIWSIEGSTNEVWEKVTDAIKTVAKEVFGESKGRMPEDKQTWWWKKEVQDIILKKKTQFKLWQKSREREDWIEYKSLCKEAKRAVSKAKLERYDELYERLGTIEGENEVYKLAKDREKQTRDFQNVWCIKDEDKRVLTNNKEIVNRWQRYFEGLLNEEFPREAVDSNEWDLGMVDLIREEEVCRVVRKMKSKKAMGPDGIPVEVWKVLGSVGVGWLTWFFNKILVEGKIPDEWRKSFIIPIFKGKGDVQECGNYRGIKLMSHSMKMWEKLIDRRIRSETFVSKNQFGFMPGKSTMEPIFCVRQLIEKYRERKRKLCMVFIDLEKAYDRVPREILKWTLMKKGLPKMYVNVIEDMYEGARTRVKSLCGETEDFEVKVGVHQGSALSPYLFSLVMDEITKNIQGEVPWCMLFADDIVLVGESLEEVDTRLGEWRVALESKGLKISRSKTVYMEFDFDTGVGAQRVNIDRQVIKINDDQVSEVECFKYLGSLLQKRGSFEEDMMHRIKCGWMKWREASGVLCDKRIPIRLKGKFYKTVVRPVMMYGSECWAINRKMEQKMSVTEMRMLRWMSGVTRADRIRNEYIRGSIGVAPIIDKMRENRLRWFGHVLRRDEAEAVNVVRNMYVEGKRGRGRPKKRWIDVLGSDMKMSEVCEENAKDRNKWKVRTRVADPK